MFWKLLKTKKKPDKLIVIIPFSQGMRRWNRSSWDVVSTCPWRSLSPVLSRCWCSVSPCARSSGPRWSRCCYGNAASSVWRPVTSAEWLRNSSSSCLLAVRPIIIIILKLIETSLPVKMYPKIFNIVHGDRAIWSDSVHTFSCVKYL